MSTWTSDDDVLLGTLDSCLPVAENGLSWNLQETTPALEAEGVLLTPADWELNASPQVPCLGHMVGSTNRAGAEVLDGTEARSQDQQLPGRRRRGRPRGSGASRGRTARGPTQEAEKRRRRADDCADGASAVLGSPLLSESLGDLRFRINSDEESGRSKREKNILACRMSRLKSKERARRMEERIRELEDRNKDLEFQLKTLSIGSSPAVEARSVRERRLQIIDKIDAEMETGRVEECFNEFHPSCVLILPNGERIGSANLWREWMVMGENFSAMSWETLTTEPLDPLGDQIRCEWIFRATVRSPTSAQQRHPVHKDAVEIAAWYLYPDWSALDQVGTDGSNAAAACSKFWCYGRSYYVFTPANKLIFYAHTFVPISSIPHYQALSHPFLRANLCASHSFTNIAAPSQHDVSRLSGYNTNRESEEV